jgi:hypothetical protein
MRSITIGLALTMTCAIAIAQDEPPHEPLLGGPNVKAQSEGEFTLVEHDFNGRLVRLERAPEEAALDHIEVDDETTKRIKTILNERNAILDRIVRETIPLLTELQAAGQSENKLSQLRVLGKLMQAMKPLRDRGTLRKEIVTELERTGDEEAVARFETLVEEYWEAYVEDVRTGAEEMGEEVGARQAAWRARLERTGEDIKRAYERIVQGDGGDFERVLAALNLTDEQEAEVRSLVTDFVQETLLNPSPSDERRLFFRIASKLTPQQRRALLEMYRDK